MLFIKKLFIDKYGMPPIKYVTHLKVNRACELIQTGMFSISEIAELCSYENVYYFSNVFKNNNKIVRTIPAASHSQNRHRSSALSYIPLQGPDRKTSVLYYTAYF